MHSCPCFRATRCAGTWYVLAAATKISLLCMPRGHSIAAENGQAKNRRCLEKLLHTSTFCDPDLPPPACLAAALTFRDPRCSGAGALAATASSASSSAFLAPPAAGPHRAF